MAYGDESEGLWQGPFPTGYRLEAGNLVVTLADGQVLLEARDTDTSVHYEVWLNTLTHMFSVVITVYLGKVL